MVSGKLLSMNGLVLSARGGCGRRQSIHVRHWGLYSQTTASRHQRPSLEDWATHAVVAHLTNALPRQPSRRAKRHHACTVSTQSLC